jgi:hypothetical protein
MPKRPILSAPSAAAAPLLPVAGRVDPRSGALRPRRDPL